MKLKISEEQYKRIFYPVYSAVFISNEEELKRKYKPVHPNIFYHHSTIEFKPESVEGLPIGLKIKMAITGRLTTDKVDVLLVDNKLSAKKNPHITLSTAEGIKPYESDSEIAKYYDKVEKLNDTVLGYYGVFTNHGIIDYKKLI